MTKNITCKQIVAMGGGGFSMEPENPLLDRYILGLSKKEIPKICFIPTASGDSDKYIVRFYSAFVQQLFDTPRPKGTRILVSRGVQ